MYRTEKIESWGKYRDTYRIVRGAYRFSPSKLVKFVAFLGFVFSFTFEFFTEITVMQAEQVAILDISEQNSIKPFFCDWYLFCWKHLSEA